MLNEKIAVITGASRGIGAAIAKKMAENGVDTTGLVNASLSTIQDNYSKTSGGANIIKITDNDAKLQIFLFKFEGSRVGSQSSDSGGFLKHKICWFIFLDFFGLCLD